jgi:hypothetical protein
VTLLLAVLGALVVAVGVALIYPPAGVIVAGLELLAAAYVIRYLEARREVS